MKNSILIICLGFFLAFSASGQTKVSVRGISFSGNCNPILAQKMENTTYYTCNFQDSSGGYILSVSVNDLSDDLRKFDQARSSYVNSFLDRIEDDTNISGGKILGKDQIAGQQSVQYSELARLDAETNLKSYTAAFILGNNAYMLNLVSNESNSSLDAKFARLIRSINKN